MATTVDKIEHGDCIKQLKKRSDGSIDLAFADPPFNIGYDYDEYDDKRSGDEYLDWSKQWMSQVVRVLKPDGSFWLAIGDDYAAELKVLATRDLGLTCRSWVIWYYTFGVHCVSKFTRSHTHIFHFVRDAKNFTFNADEVRVPSARQLVYGDKRANPKGRIPDDTWITQPTHMHNAWVLRPQDLPDGFSADSDTWFYSRVCGTFKERKGFHGCKMPEQLLGRIIRVSSNEGEVVLDPFSGSGTTLAVAKKLKRQWLGLELSEQYVKEGRARLKKINPGDPLDGPENPAVSAPNTKNGVIRNAKGKRVRRLIEQPNEQLQDFNSATSNSPQDHAKNASEKVNSAILSAFLASHKGFSTDWVLASPELSQAFSDTCSRFGIPGSRFEHNTRLVGMRKTNKMNGFLTTQKPDLDKQALIKCEFASEIAWSELARWKQVSLDEILCDPALAEEYDQMATKIAPGYAPEYYRWAALRLRKSTDRNRAKIANSRLSAKRSIATTPVLVADIEISSLPTGHGVYILSQPKVTDTEYREIYVGQAEHLRKRIAEILGQNLFDIDPLQRVGKKALSVQWIRNNISDKYHRKEHFAHQINMRHSRWNCLNIPKAFAA